MIKISQKDTKIKFEVDVSGSDETPKPRLVIPISDNGVSLVFEGTMNNGEVEVNISELLKLTDSKEFQGKLEVIIEGEDAIFVPWEDKIVIETPVGVKAKTVKQTPVKEEKIKVSATSGEPKTQKEAPIMEIKKKSLGDMFSENF